MTASSSDAIFRDLDKSFINYDENSSDMAYLSTDIVIQWDWTLEIPVSVAHSTVNYSFITTPGDVSFGLSFIPTNGGKEVELFSSQRVPSDVEPITGSYKISTEGTLSFSWDNTFSWFTTKKLSYAINVNQPSFQAAEHTRMIKAKSYLRDVAHELHSAESEFVQTCHHKHTLELQMPVLLKAVENLRKEIEEKSAEINLASKHAEDIRSFIILNKATTLGLCMRLLSKNLLQEVLSFISDDKAVHCVCKYWTNINSKGKV